ncbi:hypothetical protein IFM89_001066, partial [Coptis chinensis]
AHIPCPSMMKEVISPLGVGPWGGIGGKPFDDGTYSGIKQIYVHRGNDVVHSMLIEYDRNGCSVCSQKHGGPGGDICNRGRYGTFGEEAGIFFTSGDVSGKVVGPAWKMWSIPGCHWRPSGILLNNTHFSH